MVMARSGRLLTGMQVIRSSRKIPMTELMSLAPALKAALAKRGYESLTPVQESVLTEAPADADLLVSAQTGSGKTVAFGLASLATCWARKTAWPAPHPLALIARRPANWPCRSPEELTWLYGPAGAVTATCVGGMDMRDERRRALGTRCPHRCRHARPPARPYQARRAGHDRIRAVVLDEADEMLDMGFREDLEFILDAAPETAAR
jgi:ATP-dependent RNA helicase DeaD